MRINEKIKFLKEQLSDGIGNYQTTNELEELMAVTRDTTLDNKSRRKLNTEHLLSVFKVPITTREIGILFNLGFLNNIDDIFKLKLSKKEMCNVLGKDMVTVNNICDAIEDIKTREPHEILLGISCGTLKAYISKKIVYSIEDLTDILTISDEKLLECGMYLPQINFVKSQIRYIGRTNLLDRFRKLGVVTKIDRKPFIPKTGVERIKLFTDKNFVVLDTYANFEFTSTERLEKYIKKLDGNIGCCLDNTVDFLISNKVPAKIKRALPFKCRILNEEEFHILVSTCTMEKLLKGEI